MPSHNHFLIDDSMRIQFNHRMTRWANQRWVIGFVIVAFQIMSVCAQENILPAVDTNADVVIDVVRLTQPEVNESSGLAVSNIRRRWWTHNDSGDKACLYAVNENGKPTGRCTLDNITAIDWEDMAGFVQDDQPRLIVADCGDNLGERESIDLYLFDEPDPDRTTVVKHLRQIKIAFPDQAYDTEAIAVDVARKKIILITKSKFPYALVFEVDLPDVAKPRASKRPIAKIDDPTNTSIEPRHVTTLAIPFVSAMDIDANSGDVWVINYFSAAQFRRTDPGQSLYDQLRSVPTMHMLPRWKQIEAVAVDRKHQVWITSEGPSPPMGRLNLSADINTKPGN